MQRVLIDACGWVACIDAHINIEHEINALIGPCEWILLAPVGLELQRLQEQRPRTKPLLLSMLQSKSTFVDVPRDIHTDNIILEYAAQHRCSTLTVDTALKHRLFEANLPVIEVRQGTHLHLIEPL